MGRTHPTSRGWGLLTGGTLLAVSGVGWGSIDVARLGLVGPLVVAAGAAWVLIVDPTRGRHALRVRRSVRPDPVPAGSPATAHVEVVAAGSSARARLSDLELGEQAASQLSGGETLRARVERGPGRIRLTYGLSPVRRGRWPLGPLVVRRTDPFGVVRSRSVLGQALEVAVWPRVVPLGLPPGALVGEPDQVALGARSQAPDDAALRSYRVGDDLRRVHWTSSARRGELLVRSDERAGRRSVTVLVDLPRDRPGIEWCVSLAASMSLAALDGGHPVRLLGGRTDAARSATSRPDVSLTHVRGGAGGDGRLELLDRSIDLEPAPTDAQAEADLLRAAAALTSAASGQELVLAVVGVLSAPGRAAMAGIAEANDAFAVVTMPRSTGAAHRDGGVTLAALRRAGWRVCAAEPGESMEDVWARLLETAR